MVVCADLVIPEVIGLQSIMNHKKCSCYRRMHVPRKIGLIPNHTSQLATLWYTAFVLFVCATPALRLDVSRAEHWMYRARSEDIVGGQQQPDDW